jgi:hypothetical protein
VLWVVCCVLFVVVGCWVVLLWVFGVVGVGGLGVFGVGGVWGWGVCGSAAVQGLVNEASLIAGAVVRHRLQLGAYSTRQDMYP